MKMRNRKVIAIVCAIALVIGSFATYAYSRNVKADTLPDFDNLTWTTVDNMYTDVAYSIVDGSMTGFDHMNFYNGGYMQAVGSATCDFTHATLSVVRGDNTDVTSTMTWSDITDAVYGSKLDQLGTNDAYYLFTYNNQTSGTLKVAIRIGTPGETPTLHFNINGTYREDYNNHYAMHVQWNAVSGASYYKSYIDTASAGNEAKAANGWIWSDQNSGKGAGQLWIDTVYQTKDNTVLDDSTDYTVIIIANDSNGDEITRGSITLNGKRDVEDLNYTRMADNIYTTEDVGALPASYSIYNEECSHDMRAQAANWQAPFVYSTRYVQVTWGDQSLVTSPDSVTINGQEYTSATGPIVNFASTLVQLKTDATGGLNIGYNKIVVKKGDQYATMVFRIGGVVAPTFVTASEQAGVPGSILVNWTPGSGTPNDQVFRIYVDDDMKKGNLTGTSAVVNNIDAGEHTVKVVGFYLDKESDGPTDDVEVSTGVKYSPSISIEGFQIKSNYPDNATEEEKNNVAYRTMCKAPKKNSTIKVGGKTYTIRDVGTSYALDTNTRDKDGTNVLDASYTLLNETPVNNPQYTYTGYRTYQGNNRTYGYVATDEAIISDYKAGDTDNVYYAFTMQNANAELANIMPNTLWVRPFVVATDGTIIYGKTTAYTSVAEIANKLYTSSMSKNKTSHDYLFDRILHKDALRVAQNPFYRKADQTIQYGWNGNLYIGFRKVPDSWNGTQADEGQYVVVGDWKVHNSSYYNDEIEGKQAAASYKGNTNDEMMVRVDNPGAENGTDGFKWNWGIQMKLANAEAYSRLEDGRKYRMTITYNTTKSGIMRIKTEGNHAANKYGDEGYWQKGHDLVYDFDSVAGGNSHSIEFTYSKADYVSNPGADPSIVICPGDFNVYPFGEKLSPTYGNDCRAMLHVKYLGQHASSTSAVEGAGGFPEGTIISDVDITFTEIDSFAPDSPNVLH